jgi:transposase
MSKRPYKRYSKEFKLEAVRLVAESGKSGAQVARELGLRANQILKWKQQLETKQEDAFPGHGRRSGKDEEIRRLKKALADSEEENEFLKKTARYFASDRSSGTS